MIRQEQAVYSVATTVLAGARPLQGSLQFPPGLYTICYKGHLLHGPISSFGKIYHMLERRIEQY